MTKINYILTEQERLLEKNERLLQYMKDCIQNTRNNVSNRRHVDMGMLLDAISEYTMEYMDSVIELEDSISCIQDDILHEMTHLQ